MATFDRSPGRPVSRTPAGPLKRAAGRPGMLSNVPVTRIGRPLASEMPLLPNTAEGRLAARVRQYRVELHGWSQAELAARMSDLDHGWHQTTVAKTERAERDPRYQELLALAEVLAVSLDDLLGLAVEPEDEETSEARFKIHRLEQEEQLRRHQVAFLERDIEDLEAQRKEHLQRLSELKKEIAAARKSYKAASM